jgi:hypothetical protein
MGRAAIGWAGTGRARMGRVGTGRARMGRVGTGQAKIGWLGIGRSGTGRSRTNLQRTLLLLTGLGSELDECSKWLVDNKLSLHLGKTETILFGTTQRLKGASDFAVVSNGTPIKCVTSVKYLGLILDETLSARVHVMNILKKGSSRLKFLYRYTDVLNVVSRKTLCTALIQPYLDYSCSAWFSGVSMELRNRLSVL